MRSKLAKRSASRSLGLEPPSSDLSKGKENFRWCVPEVWMANAIQPGPKNESGFPCVLRGTIS